MPLILADACCEVNREGDPCWKPPVPQRWVDDRPRCWIHLAKLLVDNLDDLQLVRHPPRRGRPPLQALPPAHSR